MTFVTTMEAPNFKVQHFISTTEKKNNIEQRHKLGPYIKLVDQFIDDSFCEQNNGNFPTCPSYLEKTIRDDYSLSDLASP